MSGEPLSPRLAARAEALPAGPKLLALAALATALLLVSSAPILAAAAAVALLLCLLAVGAARLRLSLPMAVLVAITAVGLFTLAVEGADAALAVVLRLLALVLFAQLVTETTRASAMQDAIVAGLRPLERLPFVSAEKTGLALAVALRSLPRLGSALGELREAREARGLRTGTLRLVVPLVARILADARETAEAIDARSWSGRRDTRP